MESSVILRVTVVRLGSVNLRFEYLIAFVKSVVWFHWCCKQRSVALDWTHYVLGLLLFVVHHTPDNA